MESKSDVKNKIKCAGSARHGFLIALFYRERPERATGGRKGKDTTTIAARRGTAIYIQQYISKSPVHATKSQARCVYTGILENYDKDLLCAEFRINIPWFRDQHVSMCRTCLWSDTAAQQ